MAYGEVPRIAVSASQKVNLGNFESADMHITYSNIPFDVDEETMAQIRATAQRIVIPALLDDLRSQIRKVRREDIDDREVA